MKNTNIATGLLLCSLGLSGMAQATCNPNIALTRPDSRYEEVAGSTPAGSEVRDKVTGLVWQRCVVGMVWNGAICTGAASSLNWQNALEAARTATASTSATGIAAAWRVPNYAELFSLAERACYNPAINTTWFPATPSDSTRSSSPIADASGAMLVNFHGGERNYFYKSSAFLVRLVRSGQ